MTGLQGATEYDRIFNVFVNHLVSEVAHGHPFVSRLEQPQAFGPVKIVDGGGWFFTQGGQEQWQQFVTHGVLQTAKSAHKGFHPLGQVGVFFEPGYLLQGKHSLQTGAGLWW